MLCQVRYVTIVLYGLMKFIGSSDGPPGRVLALWSSRKLVCDVPQFRCGHVEGGPACCSPIWPPIAWFLDLGGQSVIIHVIIKRVLKLTLYVRASA